MPIFVIYWKISKPLAPAIPPHPEWLVLAGRRGGHSQSCTCPSPGPGRTPLTPSQAVLDAGPGPSSPFPPGVLLSLRNDGHAWASGEEVRGVGLCVPAGRSLAKPSLG